MDGIITANENVDKIMTEAAEACARNLEEVNRMAGLAQRGRVSRNSNAYRGAVSTWDAAYKRYGALVDMWAAVTGADEAECNRFYDRYMFPAREAALTGSEAR